MSTAFVSLSSLLTVVSLYFQPAPPSPSLPTTMPTPRVVEIRRIQAHFDSVLHALPSRDVATLTASQRTQRGAVLATCGVVSLVTRTFPFSALPRPWKLLHPLLFAP